MPIYQQGSINTTALIIPDIYVQIIPPQIALLNGVPTNILGLVGTATWGPVNSPADCGSMAQYGAKFGPVQTRKFDMGTAAALAVLQGAQALKGVRVTDGTDVAASAVVTALDAVIAVTVAGVAKVGDILGLTITPNGGSAIALSYTMATGDTVQLGAVALAALVNANSALIAAGIAADVPATGVFKLHYAGTAPVVAAAVTGTSPTTTLVAGSATTASTTQATFASKWTGSLGNSINVGVSAGSKALSYRVTVSMPGQAPEAFDNITGNGHTLWVNLCNAINLGQSGLRGPSNIIVASVGPGSTVPATAAYQLAGGTDGADGVTAVTLIGTDTTPRTGMYALRGLNVSVGVLADADDSTTWALQVAFGLFEGIYMIVAGPVGQTIASAVTAKTTAGVDSYAMKVMLGDYVYWLDSVNGQVRLVNPSAIVGGLLSNLSPQNSTLNKPLYGITGTQRSATGLTYTTADLQSLVLAGIDVIANPVPGGSYFGVRIGHNASSNQVTQGDNYTRMTNYIAATINSGMGIYIGRLQTPQQRKNAKATLDAYFSGLYQQNMIGNASGTLPWQVILDDSNNPQPRVALGYMQADCQVTYLSVIEKFLINVEGGQSVTINRVSTQLNA